MQLKGALCNCLLAVLLCITAQHLKAQSDVVDPATRVDAQVVAEQGRLKNGEGLFVRVIVTCEDLK